jgi:HD-like signal output (HDOD) protein
MASWLHRVGALFGGRGGAPAVAVPSVPAPPAGPAQAPVPAAAVVAPTAPVTPPPAAEAPLDLQARFLAWLMGSHLDAPLRASERALIEQLDALIASRDSLASLLPRTPAVIPQLMNSLRDESQSTGALAQRVARDPHLVVEVIRMANSAQARGNAPVTEIAEAIRRLGLSGLHRAILRVVLKPMFDGHGDSLTARCTQRLWQHSEAKAEACQLEAKARGLDPFEAYLAGLMHNVGWTAALRGLDRIEPRAPAQLSLAFVAAIEARRDTLFALLAMSWQLTDALNALADELQREGLERATSALGQALRAAEQRATLEVLGAAPPAR